MLEHVDRLELRRESALPPVPWNTYTIPAGCGGTYEMTGYPSNVELDAGYVGTTAHGVAIVATAIVAAAKRTGVPSSCIPPRSASDRIVAAAGHSTERRL